MCPVAATNRRPAPSRSYADTVLRQNKAQLSNTKGLLFLATYCLILGMFAM